MTGSGQNSTWRVGLLFGVLLGIVAGFFAGVYLMQSRAAFEAATETAGEAPLAEPDADGTTDPAEYQERLMALGYSAGTEQAPEHSGVTIHDEGAAYASYNVYTSAHAPTAQLMTMDGNIVHEWAYSFHMLWPDTDPGEDNVYYWRRVHLFENGDILAIIEPHGIFKVDKDSKLLWENQCNAHHDLYVAPNGHIFVLGREKSMLNPDSLDPRPMLEDYVLELDANGNEIRRVSIVNALQRTEYRSLLRDIPEHWDILHTNALKRVPDGVYERVPAFQPGRFVVSLREIGTVAVLDLDLGTIVWAIKGQWYQQHEPVLLDSGNLLLFDNKGNNGRSKAVEVDPVTQEIVWSYGMREDQPLKSDLCGLVQRLPNGNTLITEGVPGRVLEVAPDGRIVWEYVNPHRVEGNEDIIASIMDFQRLPRDFSPRWLGGS